MCSFVRDERSNTEFLVDTGACKSFVPASQHERLYPAPPTNLHVPTASGAPLTMYRKRNLIVSFNGKDYSWTFITADMTPALLGAGFLKAHNLLVDVASKQLIPKTAPLSSPQQLCKQPTITSSPQQQRRQTGCIAAATPPPEICRLLQDYQEAFKDGLQHDLTKPAKHSIQHHTETEVPPVHACFRRSAPEKLAYAKQVFREMENAGICQKAPSPWASPLHMVAKPNGTWRLCGD
ncbi:uncharacterized protein [Macrobrachium rosenbergii]|uniref:uncharacterized protein n=1 Tax=Macrobrachium rosenbergii TaxID=79674 RepID=UPI0034D7A60B